MIAALKPYFVEAMDEVESRLLEIMAQEINKSVAGDPKWREEMRGKLKRVREEIAEGYLKYAIGLGDEPDTYPYIRAMVVTFGAGSAVGNPPIQAGPEGRSVYNDALDGQRPSRVVKEDDLPAGFNQKGYNWLTNAMTRMQTQFRMIMEGVWENIPDAVLSSNLLVTGA